MDAAANAFAEVDGISGVDDIPFEDESVSVYAFDLGLRYIFKDGHSLRPYVGGGVSYLTANATTVSVDAGFGAYGMAGLRYGKKPGINLMAELIYRFAEVDASSGLTETTELDIGGLALQVGLSFVY
jgi:outer membrane protein W